MTAPTLFKSSAVFSAITFLSRILGYVRDAAIFIAFGAGGATDAFLVAFRLPNFLRRLFGEGALSQAFVPVFQEYRTRRGAGEAHQLADRVAGTLAALLLGVTAVGVLLAPVLIFIFAPGFVGENDRFNMASQLLRITFPYLLFISLTALASGILNSYGRFGAPAFTPVLLNLSMIAAALWLAPLMEQPITALAWGVLFGGVVQLAFQLAWLKRIGIVVRPRLGFRHPGVRRIARLMTPAVLSSGVMQINLLFDTLIASFLVTGSISWLYLSDRFVELPLALFGIAIGTVLLPGLSKHHAAADPDRFRETLDWGVRGVLLLALPCLAGLMLLAGPILVSLIQYREFTLHDTQMARFSLIAYAAGLPAFMLVKILAGGFYARQQPGRPMRIAVAAMVTNMVLNVVFVVAWEYSETPASHTALAIATSAAAYLNAALLYRALKRDEVYRIRRRTRRLLAKVVAATLVMGAVLFALIPPLAGWADWTVIRRALTLTGLVALGAAIYWLVLAALRVKLAEFVRAR